MKRMAVFKCFMLFLMLFTSSFITGCDNREHIERFNNVKNDKEIIKASNVKLEVYRCFSDFCVMSLTWLDMNSGKIKYTEMFVKVYYGPPYYDGYTEYNLDTLFTVYGGSDYDVYYKYIDGKAIVYLVHLSRAKLDENGVPNNYWAFY